MKEGNKLESLPENKKPSEIDKLKDKLRIIYKNNPLEANRKIYDFVNQLKSKGLDCENYLLYHILIGSTPKNKFSSLKYDLEGEYSIKKFIENLYQEITEKNY